MEMSILATIGLSISLPVLLLAGGKLNVSPGIRFKVTSILILIIWTLICMLIFDTLNIGWHWLAGVLFICAVLLVSFMLWSVLCWGYTLSMLICLAKSKSIDNLHEWEKQYAGTSGISKLTKDRSIVLVGLRFAVIENNHLVLTKYGRVSADILQSLSHIFGIAR